MDTHLFTKLKHINNDGGNDMMNLDFIDEINDAMPASYSKQVSQWKPGHSVFDSFFVESRKYALGVKHFKANEWKIIAYALSEINFKEPMPKEVVLEKSIIEKVLRVGMDTNLEANIKHRSSMVSKALKDIVEHSLVEFGEGDAMRVIEKVDSSLIGKIIITFTNESLSLFGNLKPGDYIDLRTMDILQMRSSRSIALYEHLRCLGHTKEERDYTFGTKYLKEVFGMPREGKHSYMRGKGGFDRTKFEKKVLIPSCREVMKTKMINLTSYNDDTIYEKIRHEDFNRIKG